ncbi:MAG TPA: restriction endonuclease subunit S [Methylomirabilota bacterium]|nr:restriction endonuclease subunit S [Methylomirabilota bacterium]
MDTALVKGENVGQGKIEWAISKRWPSKELPNLEKFLLRSGDVVLAMDRPWIEAGLKYAWIKPHDPEALLVQRVTRLRGSQTLDQTFLRYLIGSPSFTDYIKPIVTGVNVPHISPQQIREFRFRLPPLAVQRETAAILSAYDDLIENNTRRIQVLERMAQALYREWFVNFRFPGHAKVKLVASPLGPIPQGWHAGRFSDVASLTRLGINPSQYADESFLTSASRHLTLVS